MKRRVVQHGPSTLTISLPSSWVRKYGIKKGDEITIEPLRQGLFLTTDHGTALAPIQISVVGINKVIGGTISALYKRGCDEITVEYESSDELRQIFSVLQKTSMGYEVVEETSNQLRIKSVSEPTREEFKTLFRRLFHFLLNLADESYEAARKNNTESHERLVLRDWSINKIADLCRRILNKFGQTQYQNDAVIYHIVEQLEKIGDLYKYINKHRANEETELSASVLEMYRHTNNLLRSYEQLFFGFSLLKMEEFQEEYEKFLAMHSLPLEHEDIFLWHKLETIALELYSLKGATIALNI